MGTKQKEEFAERLVKGRIAETVFAQMYRESGNFTVLEFGYEKVIPQLVGLTDIEQDETIEIIRTAPDFAIISHGATKQVRLVEVKYRSNIDAEHNLQIATRMHASWNPSYLFIATRGGFYFDEVTAIINKNGFLTPMSENEIPQQLHEKFLSIICEFEPDTFLRTSAKKSATML